MLISHICIYLICISLKRGSSIERERERERTRARNRANAKPRRIQSPSRFAAVYRDPSSSQEVLLPSKAEVALYACTAASKAASQ